jgi:beta-lactamase regulating signal transducer with metallopeptidase domain/Flp pilus assembly protein TadD
MLTSWIIENTLMASGMAVIVACLCRFNRKRPAFCHLLWLLVFMALVAPPLPLDYSPGAYLRRGINELMPAPEATNVAEYESRELVDSGKPATLGSIDAPAPTLEDDAPVVPASTSMLRATGDWLATLSGATWAFLIWILGASFLIGRTQQRVRSFHRAVRCAPLAPPELERKVALVACRLGIHAPEVRLLEGVGTPAVWCLGRTRLLWPTRERELDPRDCVPSLIAHELAHLLRKDHWVSRLEVLATGLCWWHPLFWLIRRQVHNYAELSCDAWALWAYPAERRVFAEALINVQEKTLTAPVALQGLCATDTEFKNFERRLNMIMQKNVSRSVSKGAACLAIFATLLVLPGFAGEDCEQKSKVCGTDVAGQDYIEGQVAIRELLGRAEKHFAAKEYAQAAPFYENMLTLDPEHGFAHGRLAYIHIGSGQYESAVEHLRTEIKLGHNLSIATYNLACTSALTGEHRDALAHLERSIRRGFADHELLAKDTDLSSIRDNERFAEAFSKMEKVARLRKQIAGLEQKHQPEEALALYGLLAEIVSEDGEIADKYGRMLLVAGDYAQAARTFRRQAEADYKPGTAYYNLGCTYALAGDKQEALRNLEIAAKLQMSHKNIAKDSDLDSLRGDPRFEELQQRILAPQRELKEIEQALATGDNVVAAEGLTKLIESQANEKLRAWASFKLAQLQLDAGQPEIAAVSFRQAALAGFAADRAAFGLAYAQAMIGDHNGAVSNLEHALGLGFADPAAMREVLERWDLVGDVATKEMIDLAEKHAKKAEYGKQASWWRKPKEDLGAADQERAGQERTGMGTESAAAGY